MASRAFNPKDIDQICIFRDEGEKILKMNGNRPPNEWNVPHPFPRNSHIDRSCRSGYDLLRTIVIYRRIGRDRGSFAKKRFIWRIQNINLSYELSAQFFIDFGNRFQRFFLRFLFRSILAIDLMIGCYFKSKNRSRNQSKFTQDNSQKKRLIVKNDRSLIKINRQIRSQQE